MKTLRLLFLLAAALPAFAQAPDPEAAYTKVITERADKIVATLGITDAAKATRVRDLIAAQYRNLRDIHDPRDAQIKVAKEKEKTDKAASEAAVRSAEGAAKTKQDKLHVEYLAKLSAELTSQQVDKVKDGMTYDVVHVTYRAYLEKYKELTDEEKAKIMAYLVEARETAMDLGSSKAKHDWFGKYKGKINNYLSAAGYDGKTGSKKQAAAGQKP